MIYSYYAKDIFEKHIEQLIIIFGRLCAAGLKVNVPTCSFGLKYIPYLGYVITREDIKPDPNKVQGIMDFGRPSTTPEARALIGMVQSYRYMWPRWSYLLSPLTEAASSPKVRNFMWNDTFRKLLQRSFPLH